MFDTGSSSAGVEEKKALQIKSSNQVRETQNCYAGVSSLQLLVSDDMCCCWSYLMCFRSGKSVAGCVKISCSHDCGVEICPVRRHPKHLMMEWLHVVQMKPYCAFE